MDKAQSLSLNAEQSDALYHLSSHQNVFVTGAAGSGKSFLIKYFQKQLTKPLPIVASTGAAAVIVGGCTFHSFFSLGIMKGGLEKTIERALKDKRLLKRLKKTSAIIIDEISMIDPEAFYAAEQICRYALDPDLPFGGLKIIAVGDFFQLPPVQKAGHRFWLFQTTVWKQMDFKVIHLQEIMRTQDTDFIQALNYIRFGICNEYVHDFFSSKGLTNTKDFEGTVLFGHRYKVDEFNQHKLAQIPGSIFTYNTEVSIKKKSTLTEERVMQMSPLPPSIQLKKGALVMIRKNHPDGLYVNGTLGHVKDLTSEDVTVKTLEDQVFIFSKDEFEILNADNEVSATITNLPLTLAWASTIHKAQGASIDRVCVDLSGFWEKGQAYVALSRAKSSEGLFVNNWDPKYIRADSRVSQYYETLDRKNTSEVVSDHI
ncbi:MAG: PIF1 family ATP-dependent DNA helicase [Bdellovibrionaceae bacterium]|nr:PIF1 family ATP-dependent DNA helicase [Pseudobdellovibrionaceae bacterium]